MGHVSLGRSVFEYPLMTIPLNVRENFLSFYIGTSNKERKIYNRFNKIDDTFYYLANSINFNNPYTVPDFL